MDVRRILVFIVIGALLAFPSTAGAGKRETTPGQWWSLSLNAAEVAKTVHITARNFTYSTTNGATNDLYLDLRVVANKGAVGWVETPHGHIGLMRYGDSNYLRMSAAKWRDFGLTAADAKAFADRWIKGPAGNDYDWLISITDVTQFFTDLFESHSNLLARGEKAIGGRPAVGVLEWRRFTLWITAAGTPYPIEAFDAKHFGVVRFTDWNVPFHLAPPTDPIDLMK